jgi:hypothetical protein
MSGGWTPHVGEEEKSSREASVDPMPAAVDRRRRRGIHRSAGRGSTETKMSVGSVRIDL